MSKPITQYIPALAAWLLLIAATAAFFFFPCQFLEEHYRFPISVVQGVITIFVFLNFFLAQLMDPGVIPKASPDEDKDDDFRSPMSKNVIVRDVSVKMKWCATCQFYRPPRCSHCSVCNTCIDTFDHHCPWVNNCIGQRNYRHFFFFLMFLSIHMITVLAWCILYIIHHKDKLHERDSIITLAIIVLNVLLLLPIVGLTLFHIVLISKGRTTNEQVTGKFHGGDNPFSEGCWYNWCSILCGPQLPRYRCCKGGSSSMTRSSSSSKRDEMDIELQTRQDLNKYDRYHELPFMQQYQQKLNQQQQRQQQQKSHANQHQAHHANHHGQDLSPTSHHPQQHTTPLPPPLQQPPLQQPPQPHQLTQNQLPFEQSQISSGQQSNQQQLPAQRSLAQPGPQIQHVHYNSKDHTILMDYQVY